MMIPPDACHWAVIAPGSRMSARRGTKLSRLDRVAAEEAIQESSPIPLADMSTDSMVAEDGSVLVCAVPTKSLMALPPSAIAAHPQRLPTFLEEFRVDPREFNLLNGRLAPQLITTRRTKSGRRLFWLLAAVFALLTFGVLRRAVELRERSHELRVSGIHALTPSSGGNHPVGSSQELRALITARTAELERLRKSRLSPGGPAADPISILAKTQRALTGTPASEVLSLLVLPDRLELTIAARERSDVVTLGSELSRAIGFVPAPPSQSRQDAGSAGTSRVYSITLQQLTTPLKQPEINR